MKKYIILLIFFFVSCRPTWYMPTTVLWKSEVIFLERGKKDQPWKPYNQLTSRVGFKNAGYWVIQDKNTIAIFTDTTDWQEYWKILTHKYRPK